MEEEWRLGQSGYKGDIKGDTRADTRADSKDRKDRKEEDNKQVVLVN